MPTKSLSAEVQQLHADYAAAFGEPPNGPYRNKPWWLKKKLDEKVAEQQQTNRSPAGDDVSEPLTNAIRDIDAFLEGCPVQFQADKLEERGLRVQNAQIAKKKNRKAGHVKNLQGSLRDAHRAAASARIPYNDVKATGMGRALLDAIAPFQNDDGFHDSVNEKIKALLDYRKASVTKAAVEVELQQTQAELAEMEEAFMERERRADELAASVAERFAAVELEIPARRGRPARRDSCASLTCDQDQPLGSAEEAAAGLAHLQRHNTLSESAGMRCSSDDDKGEDYDEGEDY